MSHPKTAAISLCALRASVVNLPRILFAAILICAPATFADDAKESPYNVRLDKTVTSRWEFGIEIEATGDITDAIATAPVPFDWPEQKVTEVSRDVSSQVKKVSFSTLDGGAKQMQITIKKLKAGETARAVLTFEIEKHWIEGPEKTDDLTKPTKPVKDLAKYLGVSPYIETEDPAIRGQALQVVDKPENDWQLTRTIFDWVRANVAYKFAVDISPATTALENKEGDCEELTSLVIAFCRVHKIPARSVWVPGHCYPEFYLVDPSGKGHWYPCQAAGGSDDFGRMPEDRPILQKGDSFKIPGEKEPRRYLAPRFTAKNVAAAPEVRFISKRVDKAATPAATRP
jgi:hypothetical protein